jgi:hypothetical protein
MSTPQSSTTSSLPGVLIVSCSIFHPDFELVEYKLRTEEADDITVHVEVSQDSPKDGVQLSI